MDLKSLQFPETNPGLTTGERIYLDPIFSLTSPHSQTNLLGQLQLLRPPSMLVCMIWSKDMQKATLREERCKGRPCWDYHSLLNSYVWECSSPLPLPKVELVTSDLLCLLFISNNKIISNICLISTPMGKIISFKTTFLCTPSFRIFWKDYYNFAPILAYNFHQPLLRRAK